MNRYYSVREAMAALGLSQSTIWRRIADGTFTRVWVSERKVGIAEKEIEAYIKRLNPGAPE